MIGDLTGQRAVVTGAAGGLGSAVVALLRSSGAEVVGIDRGDTGWIDVDVGNGADIERVAEAVWAEDPVQMLVSSAGIALEKDLASTTDVDWHTVLNVNATGTFNLLRSFVTRMGAAGYGRVVTVASIAAGFGYAYPAYSASKAAVIAMTKSAAVQYGGTGVTVNCVSPGRILTAMAPVKVEGTVNDRIPIGRRGGRPGRGQWCRQDHAGRCPPRRRRDRLPIACADRYPQHR